MFYSLGSSPNIYRRQVNIDMYIALFQTKRFRENSRSILRKRKTCKVSVSDSYADFKYPLQYGISFIPEQTVKFANISISSSLIRRPRKFRMKTCWRKYPKNTLKERDDVKCKNIQCQYSPFEVDGWEVVWVVEFISAIVGAFID